MSEQPTKPESPDPPPQPPRPELPPFAQAMQTLSHITTAIILLLICGGLGYLGEHWTGANIFTLLGFGAGIYLAVRYLIKISP